MEPNLLIVSHFDDLMPKANVLQTSCEAEFIAFAMNQDEVLKKWLIAEQRIEMTEDKLKRVESQNASLETQNASLERQNASLETQNASLETQNASLERQNASLETQNASLETQNASLETKNASLERQNASLETQNASLETQNASLERQNASLETQNASLERQNASLETQNASLETKNASLETQNASLETQNASLETKNASLETQNASLETKNASLERQNASLETQNASLETKNASLERQNASLETQIKHARMQAEYEMQRRKAAERENADRDHQIGVIRELLNDKNSKSILHEHDRDRIAAIANGHLQNGHTDMSTPRLNTIMEQSASFLSDVSYDKTEEDPLGYSRLRSGKKVKRPTAPPEEEMDSTPPKRQRDDEAHNTSIVTATITIDTTGKPTATVETNIPKLNKSFSEPSLDKRQSHGADSGAESDDDEIFNRNNNYNTDARPRRSILKSTPETPMLRKANSTGRGLNRVHIFMPKTVIKPETCVPCGKRIRFSKMAMKCKECCAACHPECKDKLALPCIPSCPSASGGSKFSEGLISDFVPSDRPMIPRLIVNCANEIENRGLQEVGIYRVPGSDKDVKELKEKFLKGRYPHLSSIHDIHVICGCLKYFLRNLKEPLITYDLWPRFMEASEMSRERCQAELHQLVNSLPQANKDTLAFLVQHLQTVAASPSCKMPIPNLARVFGPTVIGYSSSEPQVHTMMTETRKQNQVMERLLEIPNQFWSEILDVDDTHLFPPGTSYTPDDLHHAPRSMLGPIGTPDMPDMYAHDITRSQATPKYSFRSREPSKPSRFFSSPLVN